MKIIFLDIDGVLTNESSLQKKYEYRLRHNEYISEIDKQCIKRLSVIVQMTGAKIVLSSSWRNDWKNGIEQLKFEKSKWLQYLFDQYHIEIIGITPMIPRTEKQNEKYHSWRENEIMYYLKNHNDIKSFCVIDDEIFDLFTLKHYLVKTNRKYGLQESHIKEAFKILKKMKDY